MPTGILVWNARMWKHFGAGSKRRKLPRRMDDPSPGNDFFRAIRLAIALSFTKWEDCADEFNGFFTPPAFARCVMKGFGCGGYFRKPGSARKLANGDHRLPIPPGRCKRPRAGNDFRSRPHNRPVNHRTTPRVPSLRADVLQAFRTRSASRHL